MSFRARYAFALFAGLVSLWPGLAAAQFALRSRVEGTITDSTGASVAGARVTLTETARNQTQVPTADARGT